jgi:hypothetical protein
MARAKNSTAVNIHVYPAVVRRRDFLLCSK